MSIYTGTFRNVREGISEAEVPSMGLVVRARDHELYDQVVEAIYWANGDKDAELEWSEV